VIVYKCVVCERAFSSKAALRGHLRVHRDVDWMNFTVRVPRSVVEDFKDLCRRHNTTTCQLIYAAMKAYLRGDKLGVVDLVSPNPLVIHINEYFLGRPRSSLKTFLKSVPGFPSLIPRCRYASSLNLDRAEIYCRGSGDWVMLQGCLRCGQREGELKVYA